MIGARDLLTILNDPFASLFWRKSSIGILGECVWPPVHIKVAITCYLRVTSTHEPCPLAEKS